MTGEARQKRLFVSELREGTVVAEVFAIGQASLLETKAGKPYLALTLLDRTGKIEARIWDEAERLAPLASAGSCVLVQGQAKSFQGQLQLSISALEQVAAAEVDLAAFMPVSPRSRAVMEQELDNLIASLGDPYLRALTAAVFSGAVREQFCTAPAAKKMHHAYLHGLLEHTLSVARLAEAAAAHYATLDRDLLLCGALLHDLAKIREFSFATPAIEYTTQGRLLGHLVLGCDMVRQEAAGLALLQPAGRLDQLLHLILSHHGQYDFGAPVLPMTREALLLHHLDDMDAKMQYCDRLAEKMEEPGWTEYQRPLERFLYLRPPARQDEPFPASPNKEDPGEKTRQVEASIDASISPAARKQQRLF